jgi:hypothetical protein
VVRSDKPTDFSFELQSVSTVFEPRLQQVKRVFPQRPVFFRACPDYSQVALRDYRTNEKPGAQAFHGPASASRDEQANN